MEHQLSRSEKKRRAKNVENIAVELVELSKVDIGKLPCDGLLKQDILDAQALKAGSRKRQIKYITKQLRLIDVEPLLNFLEEHKGSKLKEQKSFHELERLRDDIVNEVIEAQRQAEHHGERLDAGWQSEIIRLAAVSFPAMDATAATTAAIKFAKSRKPAYKREIFRILKGAFEQQKFSS